MLPHQVVKQTIKKKQNYILKLIIKQKKRQAHVFLEALGGPTNIVDVTNCATRLRVTLLDESKMASDTAFKAAGAHGVVRNGKAIQVIVGLSVPQVREQFEKLLNQTSDKVG